MVDQLVSKGGPIGFKKVDQFVSKGRPIQFQKVDQFAFKRWTNWVLKGGPICNRAEKEQHSDW